MLDKGADPSPLTQTWFKIFFYKETLKQFFFIQVGIGGGKVRSIALASLHFPDD